MERSRSEIDARRGAARGTLAGSRVGSLLLGVALSCTGCLSPFLRPDELPPVYGGAIAIPQPTDLARRTGSLWRDDVSSNYLFSDVRARFPGDLVTILISENDQGSKEASTDANTSTDVSGNLQEFFGLPQQWAANDPYINPNQLVKATAERAWKGDGTTSRKGSLRATVTAEVRAVAPNGTLFVEGGKVVQVNNEDQHVTISGWVRPDDLSAGNEVESARLASMHVRYYGNGVLGIKQSPGFGTQMLDILWPF